MHQMWGGQGLFLWPSALPGGRLGAWRGWAAEAPVCQHQFCCVPSVHSTGLSYCPLPVADAWRGGRESAVRRIERVQRGAAMSQNKYGPQCSSRPHHPSSPPHLCTALGFLRQPGERLLSHVGSELGDGWGHVPGDQGDRAHSTASPSRHNRWRRLSKCEQGLLALTVAVSIRPCALSWGGSEWALGIYGHLCLQLLHQQLGTKNPVA